MISLDCLLIAVVLEGLGGVMGAPMLTMVWTSEISERRYDAVRFLLRGLDEREVVGVLTTSQRRNGCQFILGLAFEEALVCDGTLHGKHYDHKGKQLNDDNESDWSREYVPAHEWLILRFQAPLPHCCAWQKAERLVSARDVEA